MKKLFWYLITALLFVSIPTTMLNAESKTNTVSITSTTTTKTTDALMVQLNEIKSMDISTLSRSEKKELRKEVQSINNKLKSAGDNQSAEKQKGGLYLSAGAIIIIVLLLILLL